LSRKILLADDSVTAQNMGRRILSEAGYEVVTVNNGPAALKKLAELKPDLVILDIYMPGHSGIEVCQRIKESAETANIPVLLTVGKLEPFKADEARRVHADAHLVKPFEATELLAALTKLEDKIVARPIPGLVGKSSKSKISTTAPSPVRDKKFGDTVSGWKQRLTIPSPEAKREEAKREETKRDEAKREQTKRRETNREEEGDAGIANTAFREFVRTKDEELADSRPAGMADEHVAQDITAEEIAAITAAAAAFGDRAGWPESEPSASTNEEEITAAVSSMPAPADLGQFDSAPSKEAREAAVESVEAASLPEMSIPAEVFSAESYSVASSVASEPAAGYGNELAGAETGVSDTGDSATEEYSTTHSAMDADAEVAAALESLAPVNGSHGLANEMQARAMQDREAFAASDVGAVEAALAQMGSGWRNFACGGARWIADEIAVPQSEASLILEQEMQKAYAALADFRPEVASFPTEAELAAGYANSGTSADESAAAETYEGAGEVTSSPATELETANTSSQEFEPMVAAIANAAEANEPEPMAEMHSPAAEAEEHRAEIAVHIADQIAEDIPEHIPEDESGAENVSAVAEMQDFAQDNRDPAPAGQPAEAMQSTESAEPATMAVGTGEATASATELAHAEAVHEEPAHEESAYAAAAGTEFRAISHVDAPPTVVTPSVAAPGENFESEAAAAPAVAPEHEAELAAAWAHWRQIRESVASPQLTSQLADAAAAGYKEIHPPESQSSESSLAGEESSSAGATDSSAIASIVDSVLAELKPKLVAEIARKLGKEKK
jgi:CheY-like chemotaxis protein